LCTLSEDFLRGPVYTDAGCMMHMIAIQDLTISLIVQCPDAADHSAGRQDPILPAVARGTHSECLLSQTPR
jgi:hypothetical protein